MHVDSYRYYDPKTCGFDFNGAMEDFSVRPTLFCFCVQSVTRRFFFINTNFNFCGNKNNWECHINLSNKMQFVLAEDAWRSCGCFARLCSQSNWCGSKGVYFFAEKVGVSFHLAYEYIQSNAWHSVGRCSRSSGKKSAKCSRKRSCFRSLTWHIKVLPVATWTEMLSLWDTLSSKATMLPSASLLPRTWAFMVRSFAEKKSKNSRLTKRTLRCCRFSRAATFSSNRQGKKMLKHVCSQQVSEPVRSRWSVTRRRKRRVVCRRWRSSSGPCTRTLRFTVRASSTPFWMTQNSKRNGKQLRRNCLYRFFLNEQIYEGPFN